MANKRMASRERHGLHSTFNGLQFSRHRPLLLVLLIYLSIAIPHSIVAPLTTGNDEWAHFLYVRFIAENGRLPTTVAERGEAGYKSDAPPLYHLIVAGVTFGIDPTRQLRPLDSPRRYLADNIVDSYALVHTAAEMPPYRGEVLLWHLGRGVSIFFGLVLISLTYVSGLELFGQRRRALLGAALLAFTPAVIFHSSVLSYESLSAALSALFLLSAIKMIKQPHRRRWWLALGILAGLSVTTKYSAVLLPLEIVFIIWLATRRSQDQHRADEAFLRSPPITLRLVPLIVTTLALLLAVSWWFGFVVWHFNSIDTQGPLVGMLQPLLVADASDTTSVRVATFLFGEGQLGAEARPALARNYWQLLQRLLDSFWAAPVAGEFVLSPWMALLFTVLALVGLAGLWSVWRQSDSTVRTWLALLLLHSSLIVPLLLVRILFAFDPREAAQGRHLLLPAASAIPILLVWGWEQLSRRLAPAVIVGLLLWSLLGQLGWAAASYPAPIPVWDDVVDQVNPEAQPIDEILGQTTRLIGFSWREVPGAGSLKITLWWQSVETALEDYLVELTLRNQSGRLVGYSLSHPVQGRYPTRAWEPGDVVKDIHWLPLSEAATGNLRLELRLLNQEAQPVPEGETVSLASVHVTRPAAQAVESCQVWQYGRPVSERLLPAEYRLRSSVIVLAADSPRLVADQSEREPLVSRGEFFIFVVGPDWPDRYQVVVSSEVCAELRFDVPSRNFDVPDIANLINVDFNNQIRLLGYDLPARRIPPGGRLPLTLYWQARDTMGEDYRMFDNLLDAEQERWGGYDRRARDGYSTLQWLPGEVITDAFGVPVDPAAPDGIYTIDVGWYRVTGAGAIPLPVTVDGQPIEQSSVRLDPVKVGGPPPAVVTFQASPQVTLNQTFGSPEQITLLGYSEVETENSEINMTLYWQAKTVPTTDYTVFLHLRNQAGENVAQKDSPPAGGRYPTSLWEAGEIIVDRITLSVADLPPGEYIPVLGLYDFSTGVRLSLGDGPANELRLESVTRP